MILSAPAVSAPQHLKADFQRENDAIGAQMFSETSHVTAEALALRSDLRQPGLRVYTGSIMVHMEGFDQQRTDHVETMKRALMKLSQQFPAAGLVLQLGETFYRYNDGALEVVPWVCRIPPPVVARMSAIKLPRHGRCILVEGENLHIELAPQPPSDEEKAAQSLVALSADSDPAGSNQHADVQLRSVPDPPLVLYCIQSERLKAEKLQPMFSTPDGKKALFAAPVERLDPSCPVTLRLRRGHAFSPDVTMTTAWLQESGAPQESTAPAANVVARTDSQPVADVGARMNQLNLAGPTPKT